MGSPSAVRSTSWTWPGVGAGPRLAISASTRSLASHLRADAARNATGTQARARPSSSSTAITVECGSEITRVRLLTMLSPPAAAMANSTGRNTGRSGPVSRASRVISAVVAAIATTTQL